MRNQFFTSLFITTTITIGALTICIEPSSAQTTKYLCDKGRDDVPTTYAITVSGKKIAVIRWVNNWGGDNTPESRCQKVSANFQEASEKGLLKYLTYGVKNRQKMICVASEYGGPCQQMLFTLKNNDDPDQVLKDMLSVGYRAQGPVVQSEDGSPQYYYDFEKFLEKASTEESSTEESSTEE
jgi:hypothetical protein